MKLPPYSFVVLQVPASIDEHFAQPHATLFSFRSDIIPRR